MRAFLSHSSVDKAYVGEVFKELTALRAHYDSETFDDRERSVDEIERSMRDSSLFVLFASANALASKWVLGEIAAAKHLYASGKIKNVVVFLLEGCSRLDLPEWTQQFSCNPAPATKFAAAKIRSALVEVSVDQLPEKLCLGREEDVERLKSAFLTSEKIPVCVCIAGLQGIGRRTILSRFLGDLFPKAAASTVNIVLQDQASDVDLFRALVNIQTPVSIIELSEEVKHFSGLDPGRRAKALAERVVRAAKDGFLIVQGESSLVTEGGEFPGWLLDTIRCLPDGTRPLLALVTKRFATPQQRQALPQVAFHHVKSLSSKKSKELFSFYLRQLTTKAPDSDVVALTSMVDGHPGQIILLAKLVSQDGPQTALLQQRALTDLFAGRAAELIGSNKLDALEQHILATLDEFGMLPAASVIDAVGDRPEVTSAFVRLASLGVVEEVGAYFRIAPYLIEAFKDIRRNPQLKEFLADVRRKFVDELRDISPGEKVPIEYLDPVIAAAIRDEGSFDSPLVSRAVMPSQILRVARRMYDEQNYELASELASQALERRIALSSDAIVEALRILGLSYARQGESQKFSGVIDALRRHHGGAQTRDSLFGRRIEAFLNGFKCRLDGDIDQAAAFFLRAYQLDGKSNVHILRELAQCLFIQGNVEEALQYAEAAYDREKQKLNPYVIDILLEILTKQGGHNEYRERLLQELVMADAKAGTNFSLLRKADVAMSEGDLSSAKKFVDDALAKDPRLIKAHILGAEIAIRRGDVHGAEQKIKEAKLAANKVLGQKDFRVAPRILQVEMSLKLKADDFDGVVKILKNDKLPVGVKKRFKALLQERLILMPEKVSAYVRRSMENL